MSSGLKCCSQNGFLTFSFEFPICLEERYITCKKITGHKVRVNPFSAFEVDSEIPKEGDDTVEIKRQETEKLDQAYLKRPSMELGCLHLSLREVSHFENSENTFLGESQEYSLHKNLTMF